MLTPHARKLSAMSGGTTFHFVTGRLRAALERATASAKGKTCAVRGVASLRQFFSSHRSGDALHVALSPVLLGPGEHLRPGSTCSRSVTPPRAT